MLKTLLLLIMVVMFFIWRPLYLLYQIPDSQNHNNSTTSGFQFLNYDKEIYDNYLEPGQYGSPSDMNTMVKEAMFWEKINYTIYLLGLCAVALIVNRYQLILLNGGSINSKTFVLDKQLTNFAKLNTGLKRLIILSYSIWCILWIAIKKHSVDGVVFLFILFGFWIFVIAIMWVYDGFKTKHRFSD